MTTENDLKAARQCAKYWARRYQAAQAIIVELQREKKHLEYGLIDALRTVTDYRKIEKHLADERDRWKSGYSDVFDRLQVSRGERDELREKLKFSAELLEKERAAANNRLAPGAGLLGPYTPKGDTPPADPIQGVEDGWWIGCESWETWEGEE